MHLHEADVTLKAMGLMLLSLLDLTPPWIDSFRSTLLTLYEKPGKFFRVLKKENINVAGSKLNIFVICLNLLKTKFSVSWIRGIDRWNYCCWISSTSSITGSRCFIRTLYLLAHRWGTNSECEMHWINRFFSILLLRTIWNIMQFHERYCSGFGKRKKRCSCWTSFWFSCSRYVKWMLHFGIENVQKTQD